jgi:hypothetical protein
MNQHNFRQNDGKFSVDNSKGRSANGLFATKITKLTEEETVQEGLEG